MYRILLLTLFVIAKSLNVYAVTPTKLDRAMELLSQTESGAKELSEAKSAGVPIKEGLVSKTEVTATRTIQGTKENYTFKTQVIIASDKDPVFQALDLAHELVHANHPKENPFNPKLNAGDYVRHGIEGKGGEADAISKECEVGKEIMESKTLQSQIKADTLDLIKARCQFVWKTAANDSKWKQSFYFMGQYYRDFVAQVSGLKIGAEYRASLDEKLEPRSPLFASAVAHKPYPLALLEEYVEITKRVCSRSKSSRGVGRAVASIPLLKERCNEVGVSF